MKEIKFRVWDILNKKMLYDAGVIKIINNFHPCWFDKDKREFKVVHKKDFEIMQYTGLKDRDGCEIYEGDLIELVTLEGIYEIVYDEYYAKFICRNTEDKRTVPLFNGIVKRIVGNIYETKGEKTVDDRLKKCMEYAQKCFKERASVSDNDFIGGRGLHYIRLENNQAVVVDRDKNIVVKFWFNDDGSVKKLKSLEE